MSNWRSKRTKDKWRNVVMYVTACLDQEEDEPSGQKQQQMNDEMYRWLMDNYTLVRKKKKATIFDLMKKNKQ